MENANNRPKNKPLNEIKKESGFKKVGDAVEKLGDKIEHSGMKKLGDAVESLGDKIEHIGEKKKKSA
jgi:hypothetical protein